MKLTKKQVESLRTETQISEQFNIPRWKLQYWRRHRKGPRYLRIHIFVRYLEGDVKRFLAKSGSK